MKEVSLIVLLCVLASALLVWDRLTYSEAFHRGRQSMYNDMIKATGGHPDSKLMILQPKSEDDYMMSVNICATCHIDGMPE